MRGVVRRYARRTPGTASFLRERMTSVCDSARFFVLAANTAKRRFASQSRYNSLHATLAAASAKRAFAQAKPVAANLTGASFAASPWAGGTRANTFRAIARRDHCKSSHHRPNRQSCAGSANMKTEEERGLTRVSVAGHVDEYSIHLLQKPHAFHGTQSKCL